MPRRTLELGELFYTHPSSSPSPTPLSRVEVAVGRASSLCLLCKGGKMLCGKPTCPILMKAYSLSRTSSALVKESLFGSAPPGVFVGRFGYPKVAVGPMIPPFTGDTAILDLPELWVGKTFQEIIDYRYALIRGKVRTGIFEAQNPVGIVEDLQLLAMGLEPVDAEVEFSRKPRGVLVLSEDVQPFGPSAPLKSFRPGNIKADPRIERAYCDSDLKASQAALNLYEGGVEVSKIQRTFSLGTLGVGSRRRLVPTRWSITAVDSLLSSALIEEMKGYETLNDYQVYTFKHLENLFAVLLMPENWRFEWIEAWFPGTTWNEGGVSAEVMGDFEPYEGRTTYAAVGGCYYSARLAVAEKLRALRRQASALLLREIHPGYILPVGVWNVRESVRRALRGQPAHLDTFARALGFMMEGLTIPLKGWSSSRLIRERLHQKTITDYFETSGFKPSTN